MKLTGGRRAEQASDEVGVQCLSCAAFIILVLLLQALSFNAYTCLLPTSPTAESADIETLKTSLPVRSVIRSRPWACLRLPNLTRPLIVRLSVPKGRVIDSDCTIPRAYQHPC